MRASDLESLLAADHRARLVWGYVVRQDLGKLFDTFKALGSNAGRAAIDPRILFTLWLYATPEGVGSGRELARRTPERGRRAGSHPQGAGQERPRPDPDARVMKMGEGGFRPAVNAQFATTCSEQVIVGMDVVKAGSDMAQLAPMVEQVEQRLRQAPDNGWSMADSPRMSRSTRQPARPPCMRQCPSHERKRTSRVRQCSQTNISPSRVTHRR